MGGFATTDWYSSWTSCASICSTHGVIRNFSMPDFVQSKKRYDMNCHTVCKAADSKIWEDLRNKDTKINLSDLIIKILPIHWDTELLLSLLYIFWSKVSICNILRNFYLGCGVEWVIMKVNHAFVITSVLQRGWSITTLGDSQGLIRIGYAKCRNHYRNVQ